MRSDASEERFKILCLNSSEDDFRFFFASLQSAGAPEKMRPAALQPQHRYYDKAVGEKDHGTPFPVCFAI